MFSWIETRAKSAIGRASLRYLAQSGLLKRILRYNKRSRRRKQEIDLHIYFIVSDPDYRRSAAGAILGVILFGVGLLLKYVDGFSVTDAFSFNSTKSVVGFAGLCLMVMGGIRAYRSFRPLLSYTNSPWQQRALWQQGTLTKSARLKQITRYNALYRVNQLKSCESNRKAGFEIKTYSEISEGSAELSDKLNAYLISYGSIPFVLLSDRSFSFLAVKHKSRAKHDFQERFLLSKMPNASDKSIIDQKFVINEEKFGMRLLLNDPCFVQ